MVYVTVQGVRMPMEAYQYKVSDFEGPLDLLLYLIEKNKVDIYNIPIVEITDQFNAYVREFETFDVNYASKFFVMAGCDGRMKSREYYTEFARKLPNDTVILTAGCAKYRYNKLSLGDINGIPRVLDAGQCNDSYSLAVIALKLKEIFGLDDVNKLPIVYNIAWYEQKAVIVLLALLALGVKNIHLGPTLPAFLSPNVKNVLIDQFGIGGISSVDEDIMKFLS